MARRALTAALACAALAAGCGSDDKQPAKADPEATAAADPAERVVPQAKANELPLGSRETGVRERLGEPAAVLVKKPFRCFVYKTDAGPDTWLRMCFKGGRMTGLGTIAGRKTALTLDVPEPEGGGKLERPKRSKDKVPVRTVTPEPDS